MNSVVLLLGLAAASVLDVTVADGVACALRDDATPAVLCWGDLAGLRAEQALLDPGKPVDAGGPPKLVGIETDGYRLLGIDAGGVLWKWQIGHEPVKLHDQVAEVTAGSHSLCLRTRGGQARCWFESWDQQEPLGEPRWTTSGAVQVAVGPHSWCARTAGGELRCERQPFADESTPAGKVATDKRAVGMVLGYGEACLLREGGAPICGGEAPEWAADPLQFASYGWTDDRWGWCGTDSEGVTRCRFDSDGVEVELSFQEPPDQMELGKNFGCGRWAGEVRCWGEGSVVGLVDDPQWRGPVRVAGLDEATAIEIGTYRSCATRGDGSRRCWGPEAGGPPAAPSGEEPGPEGSCYLEDGALVEPYAGGCHGHAGERPSLFTASGNTVCLGDSAGVRCAGEGDRGQLGHGKLEDEGEGQVVGLVAPVRDIVSRDGAFCALDARGVACWGRFATAPYRLGIPEPVDIALGGAGLLCAATRVGELWCRSPDPMPYLLEVHLDAGRVPKPVLGLEDVVEVGMGVDHGCVRHGSGQVSCFGRPSAWRLGDSGTFLREPKPVSLPR